MSVKPVAWTPGPWEVDHGCTAGHIKSVSPSLVPHTPTVARWDDIDEAHTLIAHSIGAEQRAANARLIASAPELAEALQELTTRIIDCAGDCPHSVVTLAHGAILLLARITPK